MLDFSTAEKQTSGTATLIPDNTIVPVAMTLRPGGAGEGGWLKRTKSGEGLMLDAELTVIEGQYARRKVWSYMMIDGATDGQKKAADITRSRLRAMLESARGVNPADESESAVSARRVGSFEDLDGLRFWGVLGIEKGKDGYEDRNVLKAIVTPDRKDWRKLDQVKTASAAPKAAAAPQASGAKPSWMTAA